MALCGSPGSLFCLFAQACMSRQDEPTTHPLPTTLSVGLSVFSCTLSRRNKLAASFWSPLIDRWLDRVKTPEQFQQQIFSLTLGICHNSNTPNSCKYALVNMLGGAHGFIGGTRSTVSLNSKFQKKKVYRSSLKNVIFNLV